MKESRELLKLGDVEPAVRVAAAVLDRAWLDLRLDRGRHLRDIIEWVRNDIAEPCTLIWCAEALKADVRWLRKVFLEEIRNAY